MDLLHREFVLSGPGVWPTLTRLVKENAAAFAKKGTPLRVIVTEEEVDRLDTQIAYYFGVVVRNIAEQVWIGGKQFSKDAWHEELAARFLPTRELVTPSGEIVLKRSSVARGQISVKRMTQYVQEVEAWAASEYGVRFQ